MSTSSFKAYGASGTQAPEVAGMLEEAPDLLTVQNIAEVLQVSEQSARAYCRAGMLPHVQIGRRLYVPKAQLVAFIEAECTRSVQPLQGVL